MNRTPVVTLARQFAMEAHCGQVRKYTQEPYWKHPATVAALVSTVLHTTAMYAAAWLHDVVEDTEKTPDDIRRQFGLEYGPEIAGLVEQLTDVSRPSDGNRKIRKMIDLRHLEQASPQAKTIKLADLIDNTSSIVNHDPGFAVIYLREKEDLLEVLKDGDKALWNLAADALTEAKLKLMGKPV